MMGIEMIRDINRKATNKARRHGTQPAVPTEAQRKSFEAGNLQARGFRIPFLADYTPKGWEKYDEHFVDMSGFGAPSEPAMTQPRFAQEVLAKLPPGHGVAMLEHGQFQCYVGVYRRKD